MWLRLTCAVLIELAYAVVTRVPLRAYFTGIERELLITACRLVSLFLFLFLFRELIFSRPAQPTRALKVGPITAVALVFMTPVFVGRYELADSTTRVVFAVTSIVVACKEECFYRGILQNILAPRVGHLSSVALSNVAFILYHYGAQPFTPWNIVEIFTAGCIFGLLYAGTGSLVLVIAVHAIDDAIWSFTPWLGALLPRPVGSALHITALIAGSVCQVVEMARASAGAVHLLS